MDKTRHKNADKVDCHCAVSIISTHLTPLSRATANKKNITVTQASKQESRTTIRHPASLIRLGILLFAAFLWLREPYVVVALEC